MTNILLMKEESVQGEDPYKIILSSVGSVTTIPVLSFEYINQEELRKKLVDDFNKWNGVIFTSKRAVESVKNIFNNDIYPSNWSSIPCYTVGEATKQAAQLLGFKCKGEKSGSGKCLAEYIINDVDDNFDQNKSLLFVCGVLRRDELPKTLEKEKVSLHQVTTYRTIADEEAQRKIDEYINCNGFPNFLVFFSPSGVNFCIDLWKERWEAHPSSSQIISIGPTTTKTLNNKLFHRQILTATSPTPQSLLHVINQQLSEQ